MATQQSGQGSAVFACNEIHVTSACLRPPGCCGGDGRSVDGVVDGAAGRWTPGRRGGFPWDESPPRDRKESVGVQHQRWAQWQSKGSSGSARSLRVLRTARAALPAPSMQSLLRDPPYAAVEQQSRTSSGRYEKGENCVSSSSMISGDSVERSEVRLRKLKRVDGARSSPAASSSLPVSERIPHVVGRRRAPRRATQS